MAGENERYFRTKEDIARDLAVRERNARTQAARQRMAEEEAMMQQGFISPGENMKLAGMTQGFGNSLGSEAGGQAYQQGIDFGVNIGVPGLSNQPEAPEGVGYSNLAAPEDIEQYKLDEFYAGYSQLNEIGRKAAKLRVDVNNPDPLDADQMEISRQYHTLYNSLLKRGEELRQGYDAQKTNQQKGYLTEQHQGPTQFGDFVDTKRYDSDVTALNMKLKEMYTRGATREANEMLFGPGGDIESARKSYTGRVGEMFKQADMMEINGNPVEADLIRRKANDILGVVYDSTKQQKLALDEQELARKKKKDEFDRFKYYKKQSKKNNIIADLSKQVYMLQNQGDLGFIKQFHPDARYESDQGATYLVFDKKAEDGFGTEEVRINVNDDTDIVAQFMQDNPKFIGVDMADYQEFKNQFGGYMPTADENWQVKINTQGFWKAVKDAQTNNTAENTQKVVDYMNKYKSMLTIDGKAIKRIANEDTEENFGTDEVMIYLEGSDEPKRYELGDPNQVAELEKVLKGVNVDSAANWLKSNNTSILNPNDDKYKESGVNWDDEGLVVRYQRPDEAADANRDAQIMEQERSQYDIESFGGSVPRDTNATGGIDWAARYRQNQQ